MAHNLALILTPVVFFLLVKLHRWWLANHSPSAGPTPIGGVKPQASDDLNPVDPTSGPAGGEGKTIYRPSSGVEAWLAEQPSAKRTNDLIRDATRRFKVSTSTVKRLLRQQRNGGGPTP